MNLKEIFPVIDALQASNWNREHFESLVDSGLDAVHVTLAFWHDCKETLSILGKWNRWFIEHEDLILPVHSVSDIDEAGETGRTGIILGFQNSSPIEDNLSLVQVFHTLGIRIVQLTYNNQSLLGTGCYEAKDAGLTNFGRNVIREMNRLGMIIDVSHTSETTCLDAIEFSARPIAVTHANPLTFHNVVRNKSDDLLIQIAQSGGMLGFSLYPLHLADGTDCSLESFCQMVGKTADLIGVEHLGIGSDLCLGWDASYLEYMRSGKWNNVPKTDSSSSTGIEWPDYPVWFRSARDLQNIAVGLANAGFSEEEVRLILGGNWYRFLRESLMPQ